MEPRIEEIAEKPKMFAPEKRGQLYKRGAVRKNWKQREFVLKENTLTYRGQDGKKKGQVPFDGNWSCEEHEIDGKKFAFVLTNPYGGRSFYCDAANEQDRQDWIKAINNAIQVLGGVGMFDGVDEEDLKKGDKLVDIPKEKDVVGLSDFDLKTVLGKGSFGKVMLVTHKKSGETYAMKVLRKEAIIAGNQVAHTKAERSILQDVNCPFIVKLHYAFQTQGKLYLILDFVRGGELFFQLKREGLFSEERVRLYCAEIILALQHLHDKDIIYRDLKPENLLLDEEGHIRLTDFGLSKEAVKAKNGARTFCGTPEYLAPEILKGTGHGKAVDWWSLGTLMYEMLTGLPPYYSQNRKIMFEKILTAKLTFPNHVKPDAQDLLTQLLARDPDKRLGSGPQDAHAIREHPFFKSLDWDKVNALGYKPIYKPEIKNILDVSNFDPEYTDMPLKDSVEDESALKNAAAANFDGFTYVAENKLSKKGEEDEEDE